MCAERMVTEEYSVANVLVGSHDYLTFSSLY